LRRRPRPKLGCGAKERKKERGVTIFRYWISVVAAIFVKINY
jgi:hypothetical protein